MGPWQTAANGWGRRAVRYLVLMSISLWLGMAATSSAHAKGWVRAESAHFVIFSELGEAKTRAYIEQLEAFKYLAELMLGADPKSGASSSVFTVYLLTDPQTFQVIRPGLHREVAGFYLHCLEGSVAYSSRSIQWDTSAPDNGLMILLHEYAHHLMYTRMQRFYPNWYVEGFAEYMSTTSLDRGQYRVGAANVFRLPLLRDESVRWIDFRTILDPVKLAAAAKEGNLRSQPFYAQSWLLTHYMLSDSARTRAFNAFFDRLGRGEDAIESFEAETGIRVDALAKELRAHLRKLPAIRVAVPNLPETAIKVTNLPSSLDEYILQSSVLQTCPGEKHGEKLTQELRKLKDRYARDPKFRLELARAEFRFGDVQVARSELEALAQTSEPDPELLYLLGRIYLHAANEEEDEEKSEMLLDKASTHFIAAYKLRKHHPPTLYFLSRTLDSGSEPSKSVVNAANAAAVLAPAVFQYAFHAALINVRADDRQMAIRVLQPFASDPHNTSMAARVVAMIEAIRDDKDMSEIMQTMAGEEEDEDADADADSDSDSDAESESDSE